MLNIKSGEGAHQTCLTIEDKSKMNTCAVNESTQAHFGLCRLIRLHGEGVLQSCARTKDKGDSAGEGSHHAPLALVLMNLHG